MVTIFANDSANLTTLTNDSIAGSGATWDDFDIPWDEAEGTWDNPGTALKKDAANTTTLTNDAVAD